MSLSCYLEEVSSQDLGLLGDLGALNLSLDAIQASTPDHVVHSIAHRHEL